MAWGVLIGSQFEIQPRLWLDEGFKMQLGRNFAEAGKIGLRLTPGQVAYTVHNASTGWVLPATLAIAFKVGGLSFAVGRVVAAAYLIGFAIMAYLLAYRLAGFPKAVFSSILLLTFSPLYANGAMILAEIPALFWITIGIYLWYRLQTVPLIRCALAGAAFGLGIATKPALIALLLPALFVAHIWLWRKRQLSVSHAMMFWGIAAILIAPTVWFAIYPKIFSEPNITVSAANYYNVYGTGCIRCLVGANIQKLVTDPSLLYTLGLMCISVAYGIERWQKKNLSWLIIFFGLSGIATFLYWLVSPDVHRYLLPLQIIMLASLPMMMGTVGDRWIQRYSRFIGPAIIVLFALQAVYFVWFSSLFSGTSAIRAEHFLQQTIHSNNSVGIVNSSLMPAIVPTEQLTQFFRFREHGIVEGVNPLVTGQLPDYFIYGEDSYDLDIAPYQSILNKNYRLLEKFGETSIYQRTY